MFDDEILVTCGHCGNKTNSKVRAEYIQDRSKEIDEIVIWRVLECPACNKLMLHETLTDTFLGFDMAKVAYPPSEMDFKNIPKAIQQEYEATLKVRHISSNACAVLARRTLEAILAHENATGRTLMEKVNSLIKSERIPPMLADVAHLGRQIGNLGAHFDKGDATKEDVTIMLEFLETIFEYLYVIPVKVNAVRTRLSKLSSN